MTSSALESCELPLDAILVARIIGAWGIKGGVKIMPYSASPQALFSSKRWYLQADQNALKSNLGSTSGQAAQPISQFLARIRSAKPQGDSIVAQIEGIDSRDAAEALKGYSIHIARASFPTPDDDEFYWVDLMGLNVRNREGLLLGVVHDLLAAGPQTTLVIAPDPGLQVLPAPAKAPPDFLIPFVSRYVDSVDLESKSIVVDWQLEYSD